MTANPRARAAWASRSIERDQRERSAASALGGREVEGIERPRAGHPPDLGRPTADPVIECHDQCPTPVRIESGERRPEIGVLQPSAQGEHHLDERVVRGDPIGIIEQDRLSRVAVRLLRRTAWPGRCYRREWSCVAVGADDLSHGRRARLWRSAGHGSRRAINSARDPALGQASLDVGGPAGPALSVRSTGHDGSLPRPPRARRAPRPRITSPVSSRTPISM